MFNKYNDGWIEAITGPMFSGKTAELIKRSETILYAKKELVVFKPSQDTRWEKQMVVSRTGAKIESVVVQKPEEIIKYLDGKENISAVVIDEVQFFDDSIVEVLNELASKGLRVIAAGLDLDFRMKPFGPMQKILASAEFVTKLTAVCFSCGRAASFSKRISGGDATIQVGDTSYEARCRKCFVEGK